jgi:hypothetical protein
MISARVSAVDEAVKQDLGGQACNVRFPFSQNWEKGLGDEGSSYS